MLTGDLERVETLARLQRQHVPFVLIDRYVPEIDCDYVVSDDSAGGYAATQHMVALGHQRIGFVSDNAQVTSIADRYAGYVRCLQEHGLPVEESLIMQEGRRLGVHGVVGSASVAPLTHRSWKAAAECEEAAAGAQPKPPRRPLTMCIGGVLRRPTVPVRVVPMRATAGECHVLQAGLQLVSVFRVLGPPDSAALFSGGALPPGSRGCALEGQPTGRCTAVARPRRRAWPGSRSPGSRGRASVGCGSPPAQSQVYRRCEDRRAAAGAPPLQRCAGR